MENIIWPFLILSGRVSHLPEIPFPVSTHHQEIKNFQLIVNPEANEANEELKAVPPLDWFAPFDGNGQANRIWSRILHVSVSKHSNCSEILNEVNRMNVNWEEFMKKHIAPRIPWKEIVKTPEGKKTALAITVQQASAHFDWVKYLKDARGPINLIETLQGVAGEHLNVQEAISAPDWIQIFRANGGAGVDWSAIFEHVRGPNVNWPSLFKSLHSVHLDTESIQREGRIQGPDLGSPLSRTGGKEVALAVLLQVAAGGGANPGKISVTKSADEQKMKYIWNVQVGPHPTIQIEGEPLHVTSIAIDPVEAGNSLTPINLHEPFPGNDEANRIVNSLMAEANSGEIICAELFNEANRMNVDLETFLTDHLSRNVPWKDVLGTTEGRKAAWGIAYQQVTGRWDWIETLKEARSLEDFYPILEEAAGIHSHLREAINSPDWVQIFRNNGGAGIDWRAIFKQVRLAKGNYQNVVEALKDVNLNIGGIQREGRIHGPDLASLVDRTGGKEVALTIILQVAAGGGANPGSITIEQLVDKHKMKKMWKVHMGTHPAVSIDGDPILIVAPVPYQNKNGKTVIPVDWLQPFQGNEKANRNWKQLLAEAQSGEITCGDLFNEANHLDVDMEKFLVKHMSPKIPWKKLLRTSEGRKTVWAVLYQQATGRWDWVESLKDARGQIDFLAILEQAAGAHSHISESITSPDWVQIFINNGGAGLKWRSIFKQVRRGNVDWPSLFNSLSSVNLNFHGIQREGGIRGPDLGSLVSLIGGKEVALAILLQVAAGGGANPGSLAVEQSVDQERGKYIWKVHVGTRPTIRIDGETIQEGEIITPSDWFSPFEGNDQANKIWSRILHVSVSKHSNCSEILNQVHRMNVNWEEFMKKHIAPRISWENIVKTPEGKKMALAITYQQASAHFDWVKYLKDARGPIDFIGTIQRVAGDHLNVQEAISAPDWITIFETNSGDGIDWSSIFEQVRDPNVNWPSLLKSLEYVNLNYSVILLEGRIQGPDLEPLVSRIGGKEVVLAILLQVAAGGGASPGTISITQSVDQQRMKYIWNVRVGNHPTVSIDGDPISYDTLDSASQANEVKIPLALKSDELEVPKD